MGSRIPDDQRKYSFSFKGKWARFWIVFGGPLANFILAYFIFFSLLLIGERLPEIKFGVIPEASQFYELGIRTGDVLKRVNREEVVSPSDIILGNKSIIETVTIESLRRRKSLLLWVRREF